MVPRHIASGIPSPIPIFAAELSPDGLGGVGVTLGVGMTLLCVAEDVLVD